MTSNINLQSLYKSAYSALSEFYEQHCNELNFVNTELIPKLLSVQFLPLKGDLDASKMVSVADKKIFKQLYPEQSLISRFNNISKNYQEILQQIVFDLLLNAFAPTNSTKKDRENLAPVGSPITFPYSLKLNTLKIAAEVAFINSEYGKKLIKDCEDAVSTDLDVINAKTALAANPGNLGLKDDLLDKEITAAAQFIGTQANKINSSKTIAAYAGEAIDQVNLNPAVLTIIPIPTALNTLYNIKEKDIIKTKNTSGPINNALYSEIEIKTSKILRNDFDVYMQLVLANNTYTESVLKNVSKQTDKFVEILKTLLNEIKLDWISMGKHYRSVIHKAQKDKCLTECQQQDVIMKYGEIYMEIRQVIAALTEIEQALVKKLTLQSQCTENDY